MLNHSRPTIAKPKRGTVEKKPPETAQKIERDITDNAMIVARDLSRVEKHIRSLCQHNAELTSRVKTLEGFADILAHDIRASIRVIRLLVQKVSISRGNQAMPDFDATLKQISDETERVYDFVENLRLMTILEDYEPEMECINLSDMLADIAASHQLLHPDRKFSLNLSPTAPIHGNRPLLWQCLDNLFRNIIVHGNERVSVDFSGRVRHNEVEFTLSNTLPSPNDTQTAKATLVERNTGIGQRIVKRIVDMHDAEFRAETRDQHYIITLTFKRYI